MKKFILAIMVLFTCGVLSGCGKNEVNIVMTDTISSMNIRGEYRSDDELYLSGYNCTYVDNKGTGHPYGYTYTGDDISWAWPGQSNILYRLMHVNIFGEQVEIGDWSAKANIIDVKDAEYGGENDILMSLRVNPGLTVEDIWNKNMGNVQSNPILKQAHDRYVGGDKQSVIDQWAFKYVVNITFVAPVTILEGHEWAVANGNKITIDIGKMMQNGGANVQLISSSKNTTLGDSNYSFVQKGEITGTQNANFTDVPDWCKDAVQYCVGKGYMSGYGDGTFRPDGNVTAGHLSKALYYSGAGNGDLYMVMNTGHYADTYVGWCAYRYFFFAGVTNSVKYTVDGLNKPMTREEIVNALVQYARYRYAIKTNADVSIPDIDQVDEKYQSAVKDAYQYGITSGKDANHTFGPKDFVTRAQLCQMIANMGW